MCALDTSRYRTLFECANVQREKWNKYKSVIESKLKKQLFQVVPVQHKCTEGPGTVTNSRQ